MDYIRELTIFRLKDVKKLIKSHGEPVRISANHRSKDLDRIVKAKQWKFEYDGLPFGNLPGCPDEQATRTNVLDHIPVSSLFNRILSDDIGGAA